MAMSTAAARGLMYELYRDLNGHNVSFEERERKGVGEDRSLYYGEIPFDSLIGFLKAAEVKDKDTFYDLGAGVGQVVLSAALVFDLQKAVGLEILEDIHAAGAERLLKARVKLEDTPHRGQLDEVRLLQGDLRQAEWSDANVIYMAATCFSEDLLGHITERAAALPKTTRLAVLGRKLQHPRLVLQREAIYPTTWGPSVGRIYTPQ